jgi:hypothetical protein
MQSVSQGKGMQLIRVDFDLNKIWIIKQHYVARRSGRQARCASFIAAFQAGDHLYTYDCRM